MKNILYVSLAAISAVLLTACGTVQREAVSADGAQSAACHPATEREIAALFDRWNQAIQTGDPHLVVAQYAEHSLLLPTLSNKPRLTAAEKEDYFEHFLEDQPAGRIDFRFINIGCNVALDSGLYTFSFKKTGTAVAARYTYTYAWNGRQWLITSHHSSLMPEGAKH